MSLSQSRKSKVRKRDGYECQFCGMSQEDHMAEYDQQLHVHHIVPRRSDGSDGIQNLVSVCASCHRTLEETQASALSELREQVKKEVQEATTDDKVIWIEESDRFIHDDYGEVVVYGFETETIGATSNGTREKVAVSFRNHQGQITYREDIEVFEKRTTEYSRRRDCNE